MLVDDRPLFNKLVDQPGWLVSVCIAWVFNKPTTVLQHLDNELTGGGGEMLM